jgi:hypothetical protein
LHTTHDSFQKAKNTTKNLTLLKKCGKRLLLKGAFTETRLSRTAQDKRDKVVARGKVGKKAGLK